jgi:hypothetical protein
MDDIYAKIESAAHSGANGLNSRPVPTDAQKKAGNYAKGRAAWQGLTLVIECPRNSYRSGTDPNGKAWSCRMAAHYGYFGQSKGADGDAVDCFIGPLPESDRVFVINQKDPASGRFDETKVMIGFPDAETAKLAYLHSYDRGWRGLDSMIPCTVEQLKWWLKHGNHRRPLTAESLPYEGTETMDAVKWNENAEPVGTTLAHLIYGLRQHDDGLLFDAVSVADILEDSDGALPEAALDALIAPYAKLERKMTQLKAIMGLAGDAVKPLALTVTPPFKQRGTTNVAAVFELSDGQTVTVYFHNPDTNPNKLAPADEMISWKWLLNKKDITIIVAPERGEDLNPREVARRIMRLAEKNSARFAQANTKRAERLASIATLKDGVAAKEAELGKLEKEIEVLEFQVEEKRATKPVTVSGRSKQFEAYAKMIRETTRQEDLPAGLKQTIEADADLLPGEPGDLIEMIRNAWKQDEQPAWKSVDPTTAEGYAAVVAAGEEALLYWQDTLDAFFGGRIVDVRNALRERGWTGEQNSDLYKGDAMYQPRFKQTGAGANIVGVTNTVYGIGAVPFELTDDMTKTAAVIADAVDAAVPKSAAPAYDADAIGQQLAASGWAASATGGYPYQKAAEGRQFIVTIGTFEGETMPRAHLQEINVGAARVTENVSSFEVAGVPAGDVVAAIEAALPKVDPAIAKGQIEQRVAMEDHAEKAARELGGTLSAWEQSAAKEWQYATFTQGVKTLRIGASTGGVVSVDGHPFDPDNQLILSLKQTIAAMQAALDKQLSAEDLARNERESLLSADRAFIQSAIDGKADFYDKAVTDRLAELAKTYPDGDMADLMKQAKTAAKNFFMAEFKKKAG